MLPIARNRALHIPHGLAALAAGICLVLAFSTDFNERRHQLTIERQESAAAGIALVNDENRNDSSVKADPRLREPLRKQPTQLLPWFPGLRLGGE